MVYLVFCTVKITSTERRTNLIGLCYDSRYDSRDDSLIDFLTEKVIITARSPLLGTYLRHIWSVSQRLIRSSYF